MKNEGLDEELQCQSIEAGTDRSSADLVVGTLAWEKRYKVTIDRRMPFGKPRHHTSNRDYAKALNCFNGGPRLLWHHESIGFRCGS